MKAILLTILFVASGVVLLVMLVWFEISQRLRGRKDRCAFCNHSKKFHISVSGQPMPCDHEIDLGNDSEPDLCGCPEYVLGE